MNTQLANSYEKNVFRRKCLISVFYKCTISKVLHNKSENFHYCIIKEELLGLQKMFSLLFRNHAGSPYLQYIWWHYLFNAT